MTRCFYPILAALICVSVGLAHSHSAVAQDASENKSLPESGKLIETFEELPIPTNRMFIGGRDELSADAEKVGYLLFIPTNESEKTDAGFPLLLFLHGIGERGDNLNQLRGWGPVKDCSDPDKASEWPFILVAPQCSPTHFWSAAQLRLLVEKVCETYPVDRNRIYITGLSMGGFGVWSILGSWPELVAAAAPICGGGLPENAEKMKDTPIWAFHGDKDPLVPCNFSITMIDAIKKAGNKDAKLTIYEGVGHDSWTNAYAEPELYKWMLSKKLNDSTSTDE